MNSSNDNIYMSRMRDDIALKDRMTKFIKDWECLRTEEMKAYILPDALIDFSIFERRISRDDLIRLLSERPKKTTFVRFDPYNYVCLFEGGRAQMTAEIVMEFVSALDNPPTRLCLVANFSAGLVLCAEHDWKFREMRLNLQEDTLIVHPVLTDQGIAKVKDSGCIDFVSNWKMHDDRIGWFPGKRMPSIVPELDMPWNVIKNPEYMGSDEEQIERTIFAYYYGVDQILMTQFQDFAFNEDAMIIYDDGTPLNLREEMESMRTQIQGSPRVCHVAKVTDIQISSDQLHAVAKTYNRHMANPYFADPARQTWRFAWARYRFTLSKRNGRWGIDRLNYYPSFFAAEK